jgi:hypothetical protein
MIELVTKTDNAEQYYQNKIDGSQSLLHKCSFRLNKGGQSVSSQGRINIARGLWQMFSAGPLI